MNDVEKQLKINARGIWAGYIFQYFYFLYKVLFLQPGDVVNFEIEDDILFKYSDGRKIYLQLKHSIKTDSNGNINKLTELDIDLWKSVSNWVSVVKKYDDFSSFQFILVSNKTTNTTNPFLIKLKELNENKSSIDDVVLYLSNLRDKTSNEEIKKYIKNILDLDKTVLKNFLLKIEFELSCNDIIEKTKGVIESKMVKNVEEVYHELNSKILSSLFFKILNKEKSNVSFEEYKSLCQNIFQKGRKKLSISNAQENDLPRTLENQIFIKQMQDIDFPLDDKDMVQYTLNKLTAEVSEQKWCLDGDIMPEEYDEYNKDCINQWKNVYKKNQNDNLLKIKKGVSKDEIIDDIKKAGRNCVYGVQEKELAIDDTNFDSRYSNGKFYSLSDKPRIGWMIGWEDEYK